MNKRQIQQRERQGEKRQAQGIAHKASNSRQERAEAQGVVIAQSSIDALADAISARLIDVLTKLGPQLARLAAVDTIRTTEKPETVLSRAIVEGKAAAVLIDLAAIKPEVTK